MKILALIPARSGSKSIQDKNIRLLNGKPLIAYSIEIALQSKLITRTIVSTDSQQYAELSTKYGAEVPFIRPKHLATDNSLDLDVFIHALEYLQDTENYKPDLILHLRPTHPYRRLSDLENAITKLRDCPQADSLRSVVVAKDTPYKMWKLDNGFLSPVIMHQAESYNMPRQELPIIYLQNACIDIARYNTIMCRHSMTGEHILPYIMDYMGDIDYEDDFLAVEKKFQNHSYE